MLPHDVTYAATAGGSPMTSAERAIKHMNTRSGEWSCGGGRAAAGGICDPSVADVVVVAGIACWGGGGAGGGNVRGKMTESRHAAIQ